MHTQGESRFIALRDGRHLHAAVLDGPPGAPVVVFEAGAGGTRSTWGAVQPAVAEFATAVAYDRAGLGRSDPDPAPRSFGRMADDLGDVLDGLDDDGTRRFVLVGHSLGGLIARLTASRRPDRTAGIVLVDPSEEGAEDMFRGNVERREKMSMTVTRALARTGVLRLLIGFLFRAAPADVRADIAAEATTPWSLRTMEQEITTFYPELRSWQASPPDLGAVPVTVISGAKSGGLGRAVRGRVNEAHARRAALSPRGRHVVAANSGHQVPLTDPELIVDEIRRLVSRPASGS